MEREAELLKRRSLDVERQLAEFQEQQRQLSEKVCTRYGPQNTVGAEIPVLNGLHFEAKQEATPVLFQLRVSQQNCDVPHEFSLACSCKRAQVFFPSQE